MVVDALKELLRERNRPDGLGASAVRREQLKRWHRSPPRVPGCEAAAEMTAVTGFGRNMETVGGTISEGRSWTGVV